MFEEGFYSDRNQNNAAGIFHLVLQQYVQLFAGLHADDEGGH